MRHRQPENQSIQQKPFGITPSVWGYAELRFRLPIRIGLNLNPFELCYGVDVFIAAP